MDYNLCFCIRLEIVRKIDSLFYVITFALFNFTLMRAIISFFLRSAVVKDTHTSLSIELDLTIISTYNVRVIELSSRIHAHSSARVRVGFSYAINLLYIVSVSRSS